MQLSYINSNQEHLKMRFFTKPVFIFLILFLFSNISGQTSQKKVLIHYMGWFGEGENGRHWSCGQQYTPSIGYYNSLSWATQTYHILLSWSCGIDGLVINVKDEYDENCMNSLVQTLKRLYNIEDKYFTYYFTISYDDQGLSDVYSAQSKFLYLRDYILTEPIDFLDVNGIPAIFAFNYPNAYLTAEEYGTALDNAFTTNKPKLIWNQVETDALGYACSFYPWVQPAGDWNGINWGEVYLDWFYPEINNYSSQLDFITGGVWAGFDDRANTCWEGSRWIDRKDGLIYNNTWSYINNYSGSLPVSLTILETWNDWNEGTQIEPSIEDGYKYLQLTIDNINEYKGTSLSNDTSKFEDVKNIYFMADSLEKGLLDSVIYYPIFENRIKSFVHDNCLTSIEQTLPVENDVLNIFTDPVSQKIQFQLFTPETSCVTLRIIDLNGRIVNTVYDGYLSGDYHMLETDISQLSKGVYFCILESDNNRLVKKIIL